MLKRLSLSQLRLKPRKRVSTNISTTIIITTSMKIRRRKKKNPTTMMRRKNQHKP